jgi:hypothetical protein
MITFLTAGILYLIGVGVLLYLRPQLMFTPDGIWKEFGIGKDTTHFSPFPFWLFCIVWAFVSYSLSLLLTSSWTFYPKGSNRRGNARVPPGAPYGEGMGEEVGGMELPVGYYMINRKTKNGIPRYIYIGAEPE